jgi:hypothetical protein
MDSAKAIYERIQSYLTDEHYETVESGNLIQLVLKGTSWVLEKMPLDDYCTLQKQ